MRKKIKEMFVESSKLARALADDASVTGTIEAVVREIVKCIRAGGKIIVFGDGGSAADSQHLAAELVGRFKRDRSPFPALALTTNTSILTGIGNDYGFKETFSRQVAALAKKDDVVIGISTSGNSGNVLKGIEEANKVKAVTVGLAGEGGGGLKGLCTYALCVPSTETPRIQELHIKIIHAIAELAEEELCK